MPEGTEKQPFTGSGIQDDDIESNWEPDRVIDSFEDLGLKPELIRGVHDYGLERPSAIQKHVILPILDGRDAIVQDPTIHKAATFAIPILHKIDPNIKRTQALILVPVRELAEEIQRVITTLATHMDGVNCHACVGGTNVREEMAKLREGVSIVVGTPGRVKDMITRKAKALSTESITVFGVDEADTMFGNNFSDQVYEISQLLPESKQVVLVSVTVSQAPETLDEMKRLIHEPVKVVLKRNAVLLQGVTQLYKVTKKDEDKLDVFCELYEEASKRADVTIVYRSTRQRVDSLAAKLRSRVSGTIWEMHGKTEKTTRETILNTISRSSGNDLIVATGGIPAFALNGVKSILIVNFELSAEPEGYVHRLGGVGGSHQKRVVVNLVTPKEMPTLRGIGEFYGTSMEEVSSGSSIANLIHVS